MTYLDRAASYGILYRAFLKARTWMWEQPYYDAAEIKLIEWSLKRTLAGLGEQMRKGYKFQPLVGYYLPKDKSSARKYAYRPFLDEIVSIAAVIAVGQTIERRMNLGGAVSFGNRLDVLRSDRLYRPWYRAWDALGTACRAAGRRSPYLLRTDVQKFYPEIPTGKLAATLGKYIPRDPISRLFQSLVRQQCPLIRAGKGLPAGPAVSGFIANLYLLPLDDTVRRKWKAGPRFRRYVDDIFFFTVNRGNAAKAYRSLAGTLKADFGLRLHSSGKMEISWSRDPLGRGGSPRGWDSAEKLFDAIYGSLFRLDPKLWRRYRREPGRFLKWYARGLRWLGIYVTTDWLAQRLLSVRSQGQRSSWLEMKGGYCLDIPDVELFGIEHRGMKSWAEDFAGRNKKFMQDLGRLRRMTGRITSAVYRDLGDVRTRSKSDLKGSVFALRTFASRLAMMDIGRYRYIFDMLIDHPWILDPTLSVNAYLSCPDARERLTGVLQSRRQEIVRAKAAWALGELSDPRSVPVLWYARRARGEIVRRSALDALLRIDHWNSIESQWVISEAERQKNPAIRKYYYLILGRIRSSEAIAFLRCAQRYERDRLCRLALSFACEEASTLYRVFGRPRHLDVRDSLVPTGHPAERR